MIKMPKKGTILAPSSLHLVLYQELLKQQDHYLSLQVLSLASFLDTFFPKKESKTSYLIQVQKALENVPSTNDFYKSIDDPIFLCAWQKLSRKVLGQLARKKRKI